MELPLLLYCTVYMAELLSRVYPLGLPPPVLLSGPQREETATLPVLDPGLIGTGRTRENRMLYRGPGFLAVVRFGSTPPPHTPLPP